MRKLARDKCDHAFADATAQIKVAARILGRQENAQLHRLFAGVRHLHDTDATVPILVLFAQTADLGTNRLNRQSVIRPQHRRAENLRTVPRPVLKRFLDEVLQWNDQATLIPDRDDDIGRSEEHTSELQSLMRNSYAVFCLKKKK